MVHLPSNSSLLNLTDLPEADRYFVAFSGGMDSTVLLHAMAQIKSLKHKITAIHVNHNIDPNSAQWAEQCQVLCQNLLIPIIIESVQLPDQSENSCRMARHKVYNRHLTDKDCLLTGHHQLDQVETMLFRLFRGTGIHGLTGMKLQANHHKYTIYRPLLNTSKEVIKQYIDLEKLSFVIDPSNLNNAYSRNFIRNNLIPLLVSQNPNVINNIILTSQNLFQSNQLLNTLMAQQNPLNIKPYKSIKLLMSALYHWIKNFNKVTPTHLQLNQFAHDCWHAAKDKNPQLSFGYGDLIRWQRNIYWLLPGVVGKQLTDFNFNLTCNEPVQLPNDNGWIELKSKNHLQLSCVIKYQLIGQSIQLANHEHHQKIKNLFQSMQVPPWQRKITPYLFIDNQLMAVGNQFIAQQFSELLQAHNAEYQWQSPQILL